MTNIIEIVKQLVIFLWWIFLFILLFYILITTIIEIIKKISEKFK